MYCRKKSKGVAYVIPVDGEDVVITDAMMAIVDPEIMQEYLRMLWAQEHRERREYHCRDTRGARCNGVCSRCERSCSGKPRSLEEMLEEGVALADTFSVEAEIEQKEAHEALQAALEALDELSRQIIELLFFCEHTEREVAAIVGLSQNGVNRRKRKALAVLREQLRDY